VDWHSAPAQGDRDADTSWWFERRSPQFLQARRLEFTAIEHAPALIATVSTSSIQCICGIVTRLIHSSFSTTVTRQSRLKHDDSERKGSRPRSVFPVRPGLNRNQANQRLRFRSKFGQCIGRAIKLMLPNYRFARRLILWKDSWAAMVLACHIDRRPKI